MMEGNERLVKLNFSPGIKAKDINDNFEVIHTWLTRERKRIGGTGLVDGFDLSANLNDFTITVSDGIVINKDGEEQGVAGKVFYPGEPEYVSRTEKIICPEDGIITLSKRPYSPSIHGYMEYVPPVDKELPPRSELNIECAAENSRVYYLQISQNIIYISKPEVWKGKELTITYCIADDRVDSILLNKDGEYIYHKSIMSTNPSHIDEADYPDCMLIGVIEWHIDTEKIVVNFYTNHRAYRCVYVDNANRLFLNGKLFKESQFIYFEEPELPIENDLWYDVENNALMIWRESFGDKGWVVMNDCSTFTARENKIWEPKDNPGDRQTFMFDPEDINLRYTPKTNALQIIVDNAPLMSDQFEEIVDDNVDNAPEYMSQGVGFRLKEPLDKSAYVECIVHHQVKSKPLTETFQRAAVFVVENYNIQTDSNVDQIYKTNHPYVVGANQLEAFVDGVKLVPGIELIEMLDATTVATEYDKNAQDAMSYFFKVAKPVATGSLVSFKISKHVWSYDHVAVLLKNTNTDIEELKNQCSSLRSTLSITAARFSNEINNLATEIDNIKVATNSSNNYIKKTDKIGITSLGNDVKSKLFPGIFLNRTFSGNQMEVINRFTTEDFVQVFMMSKNETRILVQDLDYSLRDTTDGLCIDLNPEFMDSAITIYVNGFKIGA